MIITIKREVYESLRHESLDLGVSIPELVRRKLSLYLGVEIPQARRGTGVSREYSSYRKMVSDYVTINVYMPKDVEDKVRRELVKKKVKISTILSHVGQTASTSI